MSNLTEPLFCKTYFLYLDLCAHCNGGVVCSAPLSLSAGAVWRNSYKEQCKKCLKHTRVGQAACSAQRKQHDGMWCMHASVFQTWQDVEPLTPVVIRIGQG
jgi:hypothetical protein